jgi:enediyne biosynthesis protein E4
MIHKRGHILLLPVICLLFLWGACTSKSTKSALFKVLESSETGLDFTNRLTPTPAFNMFTYAYYYNGAGIGAGDFNNDGLVDLFFAANQGNNQLYLNSGHLTFKNMSVKARIPQDGGWSTGVSVVDINNDSLPDMYVCRVGNYGVLQSHNQLLVCQGIDKDGIPYYADEAKAYGLDFSGFSTQAAFLDYDLDGDLDMYLMNHSVHENGVFGARALFTGTYHNLSGDRFFRNDGKGFTDITRQVGIASTAIGYGLGISVADINQDGYPDIYIGNDFHENDYLYINQRNGTFRDEMAGHIMHTSQFSMGVDIADINNDALPDIISTDMMPYDAGILKKSMGEGSYDLFTLRIGYGYHYQYARNNLQLNRGNGLFSEVGMYTGIYATDWSWAPLWLDFDNDGFKDLFVSNGIPKRLNDMDYVNYMSNEEIQQKIQANKVAEKDMALLNKFPQIKLPNKFFKNNGTLQFHELQQEIDDNKPTYSNGAVYADFDNDGDEDIVVNNIDDAALLYENTGNDANTARYVSLVLKGPAGNINAVGAKVLVFADTGVRLYEKYPVRGFMSSMETPLHIGMASASVDSIKIIWPDNTWQWLSATDARQTIRYKNGLPLFSYATLAQTHQAHTRPATDITAATGLLYGHVENDYVDFDREPLLPHMLSREGPALAIADINGDGLTDVFIGAAKGYAGAIFLQQTPGRFRQMQQPALEADSLYEDVSACWADVNNDKHPDLVVANGGNEYTGNDVHLAPRVYISNGRGQLTRLNEAFNNLYVTASCITPYDFNKDGAIDLFIGARAVPGQYGKMPVSYLLQNDGAGRFKDVTATYAKELPGIGFVKNATWCDIDKDGDEDLILSLEWDGIVVMVNDLGRFSKKMITDKKGWWNFTLPFDIDGDGDIDLVAGNLGLNSRLGASEQEPVRLYYNDFDGNGSNEQVLTYYLQGRELPFDGKDELQKQMPYLKKRYLYASDFAKASLQDLFTKEKLDGAQTLTAGYFANSVLINQGNMQFTVQALPWQAQLAPYKDAVLINANNDSLPDVLLAGNVFESNIQMGRYDADFGTILLNKGGGQFSCENLDGLGIKGQVRRMGKINPNTVVLAKNNDSLSVIQFKD